MRFIEVRLEVLWNDSLEVYLIDSGAAGRSERDWMLDIRGHSVAWDEALAPRDISQWDREPFAEWWARCQGRLSNLHPQIAEQWIHRHWTLSGDTWLPLESLHWRLEQWSTERILGEVYIRDWHLDPEHDYKVFNAYGETPTAAPMNAKGTWDYPLLTLETPSGVRTHGGELPHVRYLLIEGHSRYRYLNALAVRGRAAAQHEVFILTAPSVVG